MLQRVHAQPRERFNVSVTVMQGMDVLVQGLDVDEAVGKVEVKLPIKGHPESGQAEHGYVPRVGKGLLIAHVGESVSCIAVHEDGLPDGELDHSKKAVPHVMNDLADLVLRLGWKGCFDHPRPDK